MAARQFARLQTALDDQPDLVGIERLAQILVDRRLRKHLPRDTRPCPKHQHANDIGMRDAQACQERARFLCVAARIGENEIDMDVGKGGVGIRGRANGKDPVAGLVGQKVHRIGPFSGVLRPK